MEASVRKAVVAPSASAVDSQATSNLFLNNLSLLEIVDFVVGLTGFLLLIILPVSCWWRKNKRSRGSHRSRSMNDSNGKEMVPLNSTRPMDLSEFKRGSKMSNLEATNQVKRT